MTFTNTTVALEELPSFDEIDYQPLDPLYAWLVFWVTTLVAVVLGTSVTVLALLIQLPEHVRSPFNFGVVVTLLLFALWPLYQFKAARAIGYAIRDHDLVLRSGLFWRKEVIQPIRRIQHVELTRGPLEKRTGLANIKLFSAGTGKATFTVPGLKLITAARIRRYVLQSIQRRP